jgi:endo-1,4-beta-xylanase
MIMKRFQTICREAISPNGEKVFLKNYFLGVFIVLLCTSSMNSILFSQPLAAGHDKFLGSADDGVVETSFDAYWNQFTPGNSGKWGSVEGSRDQYNWGGLDQAYDYAKQRGFTFKMHTLVWGQQQPSWISSLSAQDKAEEVEEWIRLVGERYPDIDLIDVVNEAIASHNPPDGGGNPIRANYKDALGGNGQTGYDWVIWVFQKARKYIPNAKLLINDYGIINDNGSTNTYLQIINLLKDRGLIDGIGVQGHRFEFESADTTVLENNLTKLGATGLPVYISEFDLGNIGNTGTPNDAQQLQLYQKIFPVLWNHPAVKGITLWGYTATDVWQSTCYLVRPDGSERPAMQWLRSFLTLQGSYRSHQSGNWSDVKTWERFNGTTWVAPAANIPSLNESIIIIQNRDTVTVTESDSADQVVIATGGELVINPGVTFLVKNGEGIDLTSNGTIRNFGTLTQEDSTTLKAMLASRYVHNQDGGAIPAFQWAYGSTIEFDSLKTAAPANGNQNYYHVLWNCPAQTSNLNLGWNGNTIGGNITVMNTGTACWQMCAPSAGDTATVTIMGSIIQSGGQFSTNGTNNANTTITINHSGNINVIGGNFSISRGLQGGTGTTVWNFMGNSLSMSNATTQNSNPTGAKFRFAGAGTQALTLGTGNTLTALPIEVSSGSTLNLGTSTVTGSGMFAVDSGATLALAHAGGLDSAIQITGAITLSQQGSYTFSGSAAQVTGSFLPDTVNNLVFNNTAGVTLSDTVTVIGTLEIQKGALSLGNNTLNYGAEATLKYSSTSSQTTTDVELPSGGEPKNLVIANTAGVTLHASRTFKGNVEAGGRLMLGSNTLTAASATNTGTTRFIVVGTGKLKLTGVGSSTASLFPVGTSFYSPVWVKNTGTQDTISVSVVSDTTSAPFGGRVRVKWNIIENTAGGGDYTLTFGWMPPLENNAFRTPNRNHNAHIFWLEDTTIAGSGDYTLQFATQPYTDSRGSITNLGSFAVGRFKDVPDILGVEQIETRVPNEFTLWQNYPNPFNPTTTIKFSLPVRGDIHLSVINTLGQVVKEIATGNYDAGVHQVTMNGSNLASGVYFYRLATSTGFTQTKKLILLK